MNKIDKLTGEQINYYFICKTKLWLFSHNIEMEHNSDLVLLGKNLDETSYKREKHGFIIDDLIQIDFIKKADNIELHEIKTSPKLEKAHEFQLLYYIYYLSSEKDINNIKGVLNYPKIRKKTEISLTNKKISELLSVIEDIKNINQHTMPKPKKSQKCNKCAYFEFCFS